MVRNPEPKNQAKLLVQLLAEAGLTLGHQQSLNVVARLNGHRNWNVMEAALKTATKTPAAAPAPEQAPPPQGWQAFMDAADTVVSYADDAGCDEDLTVTSASAVERLSTMLTRFRREGRFAAQTSQHSFTADDVLSLRPDLTEEEAQEVVDIADRRFDASIGVNWDVLQTHADMSFPPRVVQGRLVDMRTHKELSPVVIDYSNGEIYWGQINDLKDWRARQERQLLRAPFAIGDFVAVYLSDETFVDLEDRGPLFGGDTEALHNSIEDLREQQQRTGRKLIDELKP